MDAFHPYGRVARLRKKPLEKLDRTDHFLRAVTAEREGLLTVQVCKGLYLEFDICKWVSRSCHWAVTAEREGLLTVQVRKGLYLGFDMCKGCLGVVIER